MSLDLFAETVGAVHYLETDAEFTAALASLRDRPVVALDTEFMRERTYYAKLCLLQIATDEETLLIDTLKITDFRPLAALLTDPRVTKVFHAGGQDLEILWQVCGVVVSPYFDTQDAAELVGYSTQVGYGALVEGELAVKLRKADSFTDWARRPLTKAQLIYAAEDVIYLLRLYPLLCDQLSERGRLSWLQPMFQTKTDPATLEPDPREVYRKVKQVAQLRGAHLAVARELGAWREEQARRSDRPRRWILSDESLIEIARRLPRTQDEVKQIRGVKLRNVSQLRSLLAAVQAGIDLAPEQWPEQPGSGRSKRDLSMAVDLLSALVRMRARENNIAVPLLASRDQLKAFALDPDAESPLLQGWRRDIVGAELLQLLRGNLVLSLEGDRLIVKSNADSNDT